MEFSGFDEFLNVLNNTADNFEEEAEKLVNKTGNRVLRKVKQLTPVAEKDGGTLRRSWEFEKIDSLQGVVKNPVHYAPHIEYGHRTRLGKGGNSKNPKYKYKPKPDGIKMVQGRFMLRRSVESVNKSFASGVETLVDNLFNE